MRFDFQGLGDLRNPVRRHGLLTAEGLVEGGSLDSGEVGELIEAHCAALSEQTDLLRDQPSERFWLHTESFGPTSACLVSYRTLDCER